ncbi:MAG: hypothetical protein WCE81_03200 [Halobacteriota archaeon]
MGEIGPKTPQKIGKMNEMKLKISEISEIPKNRYVSSFFPLIRDMLPQVMVAVLEKIGEKGNKGITIVSGIIVVSECYAIKQKIPGKPRKRRYEQ